MITRISAYIMPLVILIIVGYGLYKKSDNYDNFIKGAADGMKTVVDIAPTLVGLEYICIILILGTYLFKFFIIFKYGRLQKSGCLT